LDRLLANSASGTNFPDVGVGDRLVDRVRMPGELRILLACDEQDTLPGIAPLRRQTVRRYGATYRLFHLSETTRAIRLFGLLITRETRRRRGGFFTNTWKKSYRMGLYCCLNEIRSRLRTYAFASAGPTRWNGMEGDGCALRHCISACDWPATKRIVSALSLPRFARSCGIWMPKTTCNSSFAISRNS